MIERERKKKKRAAIDFLIKSINPYYGITYIYIYICIYKILSIDDCLPTTNQHRANREELLGERVGRHISKSHRCQAAAREIQSGDVTFRVGYVLHRNLQFFRQRVNPAEVPIVVVSQSLLLCDYEPDTGQPMSHQDEEQHQHGQNHRAVLRVSIHLLKQSSQPQ